jgi:putative FmdB family regulatory protein
LSVISSRFSVRFGSLRLTLSHLPVREGLRKSMPLYEYECKKCHHRFERIQKFSDPHVKKCPKCRGPIEQVISAPAVQFKGSGWYVTDYAKKSSTGSASSSSNGDSASKNEAKSKSEDSSKSESSSKSDGAKESSKKSEDSSKKRDKK